MEFRYALINWRVKESACILSLIGLIHAHTHVEITGKEWAREQKQGKEIATETTDWWYEKYAFNIIYIHTHNLLNYPVHKAMKIDKWKKDGIKLTEKSLCSLHCVAIVFLFILFVTKATNITLDLCTFLPKKTELLLFSSTFCFVCHLVFFAVMFFYVCVCVYFVIFIWQNVFDKWMMLWFVVKTSRSEKLGNSSSSSSTRKKQQQIFST